MKLSNLEMDVMQVIWDEGEAIAPDVHKRLAKDRSITYHTVKTMIDRLEEKGAVSRIRTYGRTILYGPAIRKDELTGPVIKDFVKRMFSGQALPLISHLLSEEELSDDELQQLEEMVRAKRQEDKP